MTRARLAVLATHLPLLLVFGVLAVSVVLLASGCDLGPTPTEPATTVAVPTPQEGR